MNRSEKDIVQTRELGASDLIFALDLTPGPVDVLATMERLRYLAE